MSWLPDAPHLILLLRRIENDKDPIRDASELFWLFCKESLSPDEFRDRVLFLIDSHLKDSPKGGGFIDPDIKEIILQGPERVAQVVVDRLDTLSETKKVPYQPDEADDPVGLYVYTHIEAARLFRMLKVEAYSEKTREILSNALSAFNRCNKVGDTGISSFSLERSISLKAIGSFLYITQFLIQKADGDYENAMKSLKEGILHIQAAHVISVLPEIDPSIPAPEIPSIGFHLGNKDIRQSVPWFQSIEPQVFVDCFEALRIRGHITDIESIIEVCGTIKYVSNESWLASAQKAGVKDADGYYWEQASEFWQYALGWVEAQLKPSELRELLHERRDCEAEGRLSTYFFGDELWVTLPERTKSSLISADRDWFSGSGARTEAILNEIKIATEELLLQELWKPLEQWFANEGRNHQGAQDFLSFKAELVTRGRVPTILDLECICRMPFTGVFLAGKGVLREDRE